MPVKKEREYRTLVAPLAAQSSGEKRLQSECYVEGYATTFNAPYLSGQIHFIHAAAKAGKRRAVSVQHFEIITYGF